MKLLTLSVSLNYNPGHFSHLAASYRMFEDLGFESVLYINPLFDQMDDRNEFQKIHSLKDLYDGDTVKRAIFWFPSIKNIPAILKLKLKFRSNICYVFHEPFDSVLNYRRGGFSWLKIFKTYLINVVNIVTVIFSDQVLLPSNKSYNLYKKSYKKYNSNFAMIPLIFDDEAEDVNIDDKNYISYIGTIAADHAFQNFIELFKFAKRNDLLRNFKFCIATKSNIEVDLLHELTALGDIEIKHGFPLSNAEINTFYARSYIIWNAYNRSNQSGVLPKSYMFGTPVISTVSSAGDFVQNDFNSILIENNRDYQKICEKIIGLENIYADMSANARNTFLEKFYYKNYINHFKND